jgi:hypothetical protein
MAIDYERMSVENQLICATCGKTIEGPYSSFMPACIFKGPDAFYHPLCTPHLPVSPSPAIIDIDGQAYFSDEIVAAVKLIRLIKTQESQ